jgi:hypothetical protein
MNDELDALFESIKEEIADTIANSTEIVIPFHSCVKIQKRDYQILPSKIKKRIGPFDVFVKDQSMMDIYDSTLIDSFYRVNKLYFLTIYVDDIDIYYEERGLYDNEIKDHYMTYSIHMGGSAIFLPCIIGANILSFLYNTAIWPYIFCRYYQNPTYYFYHISMTLRKSMVIQ